MNKSFHTFEVNTLKVAAGRFNLHTIAEIRVTLLQKSESPKRWKNFA